jgi:hypothetical protein
MYRHRYRQFFRLQGSVSEHRWIATAEKPLVLRCYLNRRERMRTSANDGMAGEPGFEPRFSESESDVLPLNYSPLKYLKVNV